MIIHHHRYGLRIISVFKRVITHVYSQSDVHSFTQNVIRLRFSLCGYIYNGVRIFSSESDSPSRGSLNVPTKEQLDAENRNKDNSENLQNCGSNFTTTLPDEEKHLEPALSTMMDEKTQPPSALKTISVVPGKGPPPEPPITCCMSGCVNCVWIKYAEELRDYYSDGGEKARAAVEKIEDVSLRAFVKLELGL